MNDWKSVWPVLAMLAVLALSLLVIQVLVSQDAASLIVPQPEQAAEGFVKALGAHRYEGAISQLSQDLRQQVKWQDLRAIVQAIEQSTHNGIQDSTGEQSQEQGDQATASVKVKFGNNEELTIDLPLKKENGLWKVSSLEPVEGLAGSSSLPLSGLRLHLQ